MATAFRERVPIPTFKQKLISVYRDYFHMYYFLYISILSTTDGARDIKFKMKFTQTLE